MILSSVLHRELLNEDGPINILWTPTDHSLFKTFISSCFSAVNFYEFDQTYFGFVDIDIIICNNRISYLEKCIELAKYIHCPLLVVDHDIKPANITIENNTIPISSVEQIALNQKIKSSWNNVQDKILSYDLIKRSSKDEWNHIIYSLIKSVSIIK
jgi:hypothetical protein